MILSVTSLSGSCDKEKSGILGHSVQRKRSGLKKKCIRMLRDIADKKKKKKKKKNTVSDWTEVDESFCIYERFTPKCISFNRRQL